MKPVDIVFMVVVVAVAGLMLILKGKVPAWLGFVLVLLGGLVAIVGGADASAGKYPDPDTLGAAVSNAPWWARVISLVLVIGGFAVGFAIPNA